MPMASRSACTFRQPKERKREGRACSCRVGWRVLSIVKLRRSRRLQKWSGMRAAEAPHVSGIASITELRALMIQGQGA